MSKRRSRRQQEELDDLARLDDNSQVQTAIMASLASEGENDEANAGDDDDQDNHGNVGQTSAFAVLAEAQTSDNDDDTPDPSKSKKKSKKKKRKTRNAVTAIAGALGATPDDGSADHAAEGIESMAKGTRYVTPPQAAPNTFKSGTNGTPSKRKGKSKGKNDGISPVVLRDKADDGLDEIDRALRDLDTADRRSANLHSKEATDILKHTCQQRLLHSTGFNSQIMRPLLAVDKQHLDPLKELERFFGSKVIASAGMTNSPNQPVGARARNPHHALGRQFASRAGGFLAKPQQNWPPAATVKGGLSMELIDEGNSTGQPVWSFQHSRVYKEVTKMFLQAISSHDPNALMALLHVHPYHIENLLQLSDMAGQQGDQGMSADFLDRALYAFERALAPNFNLQMGTARLDFRRIESRQFFRALEKRVSSLMKRGTWRTLHEYAKLLYACSPIDDPYGALIYLDFTAPKARQYHWLVDFVDALPRAFASDSVSDRLTMYPGLYFAKALSLWHLEQATYPPTKSSKTTSTECEDNVINSCASAFLLATLLQYPLTSVLLLEKLGARVPESLARLPNAQAESGFSRKPSYILQLTSALYVHRSDTLWREPDVLAWLNSTARKAGESIDSNSNDTAIRAGLAAWDQQIYPNGGVPEGILRHVLVSDVTQLRAYLPPGVLATGLANAYDPLPPRDGSGYDSRYFATLVGTRTDGSRNQAAAGEPRQADVQGLFQRMMQYLQTSQGPDGEALDPDTEAAIIAQLEHFTGMDGVAAIGNAEEAIPGGFLSSNSDDEEGEEIDHEHTSEAGPDESLSEQGQQNQNVAQPPIGLGGLLRGFWRGNAPEG